MSTATRKADPRPTIILKTRFHTETVPFSDAKEQLFNVKQSPNNWQPIDTNMDFVDILAKLGEIHDVVGQSSSQMTEGPDQITTYTLQAKPVRSE